MSVCVSPPLHQLCKFYPANATGCQNHTTIVYAAIRAMHLIGPINFTQVFDSRIFSQCCVQHFQLDCLKVARQSPTMVREHEAKARSSWAKEAACLRKLDCGCGFGGDMGPENRCRSADHVRAGCAIVLDKNGPGHRTNGPGRVYLSVEQQAVATELAG